MTIAHPLAAHELPDGGHWTCKAVRDGDLPCCDPALFLYDPITVTISCVWVKLQAGSAGGQFPGGDFHLLLQYSLLLHSSSSSVNLEMLFQVHVS